LHQVAVEVQAFQTGIIPTEIDSLRCSTLAPIFLFCGRESPPLETSKFHRVYLSVTLAGDLAE
jgi:hypothetical protein